MDGFADAPMHTNDNQCCVKFSRIEDLPLHQLTVTPLQTALAHVVPYSQSLVLHKALA